MKLNLDSETRLGKSSTRIRRPTKTADPLAEHLRHIRGELNAKFAAWPHSQKRLLQLAINEAEALAWSTSYPHLVFPILAEEKINYVAAWYARQAALHRSGPVMTFAV